MTIVGKILVFLNLVFSLIVGGLVMVVFMTRTNWENEFKKRTDQYNAVIADQKQTQEENAALKQKADADLKAANQARDDAIKLRDAAKQAQARAEAERDALKLPVNADSAKVAAIEGSLKLRTEQVAQLEKDVEKERNEKHAMIEEKNKERAARLLADISSNSFKARNFELEGQVKELYRELIKTKTGVTGTVATKKRGEENPPLENVKGTVTRADPETNLAQLSIGSDAGLLQGHTLHVYRLNPIADRSIYLGVLEIVEVTPHAAVGRPLKPMGTPMRPGDRVAAHLGN